MNHVILLKGQVVLGIEFPTANSCLYYMLQFLVSDSEFGAGDIK